MSADSPQFEHLLCIPKCQSVTFGYPDLKYLCAFQFFQAKRGMSRILEEKSELFVNP
jgi:hypothetical protein